MDRPPLLRATRTSLLLLGLAAACACAGSGSGSFAQPETKPPIVVDGWKRADRGGMRVYTNASDATARLAFRQLGRFTDVVSRVAFGRSFVADARFKVFVFGKREEYLRFSDERLAGHASRYGGQNATGLSIEQVFQGTGTLYHELVHVVLHSDPNRGFPSWFHEGLAVFLGSSVLRGDVLTVGQLDSKYLPFMRAHRPTPLRKILSSTVWGSRNSLLFYGESWAFVHFGLLSKTLGGRDHRAAFSAFVSSVSQGEPWEPAFQAAYGATPEEIDPEYERHRERLLDTRVSTVANIRVDLSQPPLDFRAVEPLEITRELAKFGMNGSAEARESSGRLFDKILEVHPKDREAILDRILVAVRDDDLDLGDALWARLDEEARQGVDAWLVEGDLSLAHAKNGSAKEASPQRAADLERALSAYTRILSEQPHYQPAVVGLGRALVLAEDEDPDVGIAALERAIVVEPNWFPVRLDLAELLIRKGSKSEAAPHLAFVIDAVPRSEYAKRAKKLQRRLK
jgi:tetratricopeptide (TPR) repeat protein